MTLTLQHHGIHDEGVLADPPDMPTPGEGVLQHHVPDLGSQAHNPSSRALLPWSPTATGECVLPETQLPTVQSGSLC